MKSSNEVNSYFDFEARKNVNAQRELLPGNSPKDEDSEFMTPGRMTQVQSTGKNTRAPANAVSQSKIIYKREQVSQLVTEKQDKPIDFDCFSNTLEEEVKLSQTTDDVQRPEPSIFRMQSVTYKKPYRELNDLQNLHNFQVSEKPIWVVKFRQDGKYLATGGLDGVLRVY